MDGVLPIIPNTSSFRSISPSRWRQRKSKSKKSGNDAETGDSKIQGHKRLPWLKDIPHASTFTLTEADMNDPEGFFRRIESEGVKYGICKIRVPEKYRSQTDRIPTILRDFTFTAREQKLKEHVWESFGNTEIIYEHAQRFDLKRFQETVRIAAEKLLKDSDQLPAVFVESEFWRLKAAQDSRDVYILYGNDVEGTACDRHDPDSIGSTKWNLQDLGKSSWSLLRHAPMEYPGVTTPMMYVGSLFSTFFWHVEDHWMHSINFSHYGATKTWYGIPSSHAEAFEKVVKEKVYKRVVRLKRMEIGDPIVVEKIALKQLLEKNTLFCPKLLIDAGVPVYRLDQEPGDFILTFPRGYHAGFSHGFNIGEAVNFALPEWLLAGKAAVDRYCFLKIPQILPHQLLLVKEAAAVFDRLQRTQNRPSYIERLVLDQFCTLTDEHARLRRQLAEENGLEEESVSGPLKSQICFMCHRHICGPYVRYTASTTASRCMQCSVRVSHISHPEWKLAVPEVVEMIEYLEHQFREHYGVKSTQHPLSWKIPRRRRSHCQHPPHCLSRKRKVAEHVQSEKEAVVVMDAVEDVKKRRKQNGEDILKVAERRFVAMPDGRFLRTAMFDGEKIYILAQELLLAIGAPIKRPLDVDTVLYGFLLDGQAKVNRNNGSSPIPSSNPTLVKRLCHGPSGSVTCTVVDQHQMVQIVKAISDPTIRERLFRFLGNLWKEQGHR